MKENSYMGQLKYYYALIIKVEPIICKQDKYRVTTESKESESTRNGCFSYCYAVLFLISEFS